MSRTEEPVALVFTLRRHPSLSPQEFREHYDKTYIPLVEKLCTITNANGEEENWFPSIHRRVYISRPRQLDDDSNASFPAATLMGDPSRAEVFGDAIALLVFASPLHCTKFLECITEGGELKKEIWEIEEKFMDMDRVRQDGGLLSVWVSGISETYRLPTFSASSNIKLKSKL
jgi:hypothetical protein